MGILADLVVLVSADISRLKGGLATASESIGQFGETASRIGGTMTRNVTLPLVGVATGAIVAAGRLEQSRVAFETLLGSAEQAGALLADLQRFGAETPFEFPEIQAAAKSLLAFGVAAEDIVPTMTQIGDLASGLGIPFNELAQIYGKAKTQGRLFMEDINQLTGRGIPIIQELAKQFGVSEAEVRDLVTAGEVGFPEMQAAFAALTGEGGQFQGMMAAQSQTLFGLFSTLKDNVMVGLASVGQTLIDTFDLKTKLAGAIQWVGEMAQKISDFAKNNPELFKAVAIFAAIAAAAGPLLMVIGSIATGVAALGAVFTALSAPVIAVVAVIVGLAYLIYKAWETNFAGIRDFAAGIWTAIQAAFAAFKALFSGDWDGFLSKIKEAWSLAWNAVVTFLGNLWAMVQPKLAAWWESIKTWFATMDWKQLGYDIVTKILTGLATIFAKVQAWVGEVFTKAKEWFASIDWGALARSIIDGIVNVLRGATAIKDALLDMARGAWEAVKAFFGIDSPSKLAMEAGQHIVSGLARGLTDVSAIESAVPALGAAIPTEAGGPMSSTSLVVNFNAPVSGDDADYITRRIMEVLNSAGRYSALAGAFNG